MTLQEILIYFNETKTIGENKEAVDLMRYYSREAQKITMQLNTAFHEPEEIVKLFSELIGKEVDPSFRLFRKASSFNSPIFSSTKCFMMICAKYGFYTQKHTE